LESNVNQGVRERLAVLCVLFFAVGLGGCDTPPPNAGGGGGITVGPRGTISVAEMARRLSLSVQYSSPHGATLGDRLNTVVFFADPDGATCVNGRKVDRLGDMVTVEETLFVPEKLERTIRRLLRLRPRPVTARPVRTVSSRRTAAVVPEARPKLGPVVIDPGHGGRDPGTHHHGVREKDIALNVGLMAARELEAAGVDVRMTRSDDTFIELNDRAALSNRIGAKLFVSLHVDYAPNRRARGFTIYAPRTRMQQARAAGRAMVNHMLGTGLKNRGVRPAGFRVLVRTRCPALLVEMGYVSNAAEARVLARNDFQIRLSRAIASGVLTYLTSRQ